MFTPFLNKDDFLNREPFIKDEVQFNLMHRIAEGELAIALRAEEHALALQNPGRPLLIWVNKELCTSKQEKLLDKLYEEIKDYQVEVISAEPEIAMYITEKYAHGHNLGFNTKMNLMSFHCLQVILPKNIKGEMRQAELRDLETIAEFRAGFIYYAFNKEVEKTSQLELAERIIKSKRLYVWEVNNQVVCMAYIAHQSQRHSRINNVYTPLALRGNGYASFLMAMLSKKLLTEGSIPVLFTDLSNPISNRVYKKVGYTECGKIDELRIIY